MSEAETVREAGKQLALAWREASKSTERFINAWNTATLRERRRAEARRRLADPPTQQQGTTMTETPHLLPFEITQED